MALVRHDHSSHVLKDLAAYTYNGTGRLVETRYKTASVSPEVYLPRFDSMSPTWAARDLLRRPVLRQPGANGTVDLGVVHFAHERAISSPPLGQALGLRGAVFVAGPVAAQKLD